MIISDASFASLKAKHIVTGVKELLSVMVLQ